MTEQRLGSDARRYSELAAAMRLLKVRGFMSPASTCSRSETPSPGKTLR
ncbi:MAG: hypothetical protein VYE46_08300 [Cyanobacteriota bacterium]|nr:hypothetical protein [Cyanobacteriota bacterium]